MSEIQFGGIDCLMLKDLRVAIKTLYNLEVNIWSEFKIASRLTACETGHVEEGNPLSAPPT